MIKRTAASIAAAAFALILCWVGGIDFDQRGQSQALALWVSFLAGVFCYTYPGWRND